MTDTAPNFGIHDVRPFIGSKDYDAARDFYVALGWRVTYDADDLRLLELESHNFYLQNAYQQEWCDNTMLHVSVFDVDAWYERVCATFEKHSFGGKSKLRGPPMDRDYGRVFHVLDPTGVLIHFCQFH